MAVWIAGKEQHQTALSPCLAKYKYLFVLVILSSSASFCSALGHKELLNNAASCRLSPFCICFFHLVRLSLSQSAVGKRYFCDVVIVIKDFGVGLDGRCFQNNSWGQPTQRQENARYTPPSHQLVTAKRGNMETSHLSYEAFRFRSCT